MPLQKLLLMPGVAVSVTFLLAGAARGQSVVVQQPVIGQFGVNTVVTVPDRGSMLLGSVGSSARFARRSGPFRSGSSVSRSVHHQSAQVTVTIHDLEAMDAALLSGTDANAIAGRGRPLTGMAARASEQLLQRHREVSHSRPGGSRAVGTTIPRRR